LLDSESSRCGQDVVRIGGELFRNAEVATVHDKNGRGRSLSREDVIPRAATNAGGKPVQANPNALLPGVRAVVSDVCHGYLQPRDDAIERPAIGAGSVRVGLRTVMTDLNAPDPELLGSPEEVAHRYAEIQGSETLRARRVASIGLWAAIIL